eukprot:516479-Prymnesium_polylepis.1
MLACSVCTTTAASSLLRPFRFLRPFRILFMNFVNVHERSYLKIGLERSSVHEHERIVHNSRTVHI